MSETVTLRVTGMSCTGCEQRIGKLLGRLDGVGQVSADHRSGEVRFRLDGAVTALSTVVARIEDAGYQVSDTGEEQR